MIAANNISELTVETIRIHGPANERAGNLILKYGPDKISLV